MLLTTVHQLFLSNVGFVVLLKGDESEKSLPIFIGAAEAQAIAIWMNKVHVPRPLTHDLLRNVLDMLECRLIRVEVCDITDGTFFARLILSHKSGELTVDARPSDAIALALRFEAPIYVHDKVMEEAGRVFTPEEQGQQQEGSAVQGETPHPKPTPRKLTPLEALKRDLETAVQEERYEDAARLRDEINRLEKSHSKN